ncbi:hypothetical protein JXA12_03410 [Candidatus Woesearchaeota archaeon]|nr:hypothetical protein [Candidatus Woesearchaeota archaeon]
MKQKFAVDLDETLAHTNILWADHHIKYYGNPEKLNANEIVRKYSFVKNVPYWQFAEASKWVESHINSSDAKLEIPVIKQAKENIQYIPIACYLTNRPFSTIQGTKEWLSLHNFPKRPVLSANKGLEWKAQQLERFYPYISGIIDDNVEITNYLSEQYEGKIILYSNQENMATHLDVVVCPTWNDIAIEVQRLIRE